MNTLIILLFFLSNIQTFAVEETKILISISKQQLYLYRGKQLLKVYPLSTGRGGAGNIPKTGKTPLGKHLISAKLGAGEPKGTIFNHRGNTRKIKKNLRNGALMTSRILKLRGATKDNHSTEKRGIYIHGTSAEHQIGKAVSSGCIRMKNNDIIEVFDQVKVGTVVEIKR